MSFVLQEISYAFAIFRLTFEYHNKTKQKTE